MNIKVLGLVGLFAIAAPVVVDAAPAGGLTAHGYADLATAPQTASDAAVRPGDPTAKVEKIWWRRGYGWRRYGWRGPFIGYGYGWRRPYWRRRFYW